VGVWSFLIRYIQTEVPGTPERSAANFLTISLVAFMVGRFAGTASMRFAAPARILTLFGVVAVGLVGFAMLHPGRAGVWALVATSFFMSVMFPTIFALGLRGLNDAQRKLGSSLLVMAIIGGAVLTALMGAISDAAGIANAFGVPLVGFVAVVAFALYNHRRALGP
jgi:MFS transporter, FHS family, L-fucose permease